jgi:hypothetical protein
MLHGRFLLRIAEKGDSYRKTVGTGTVFRVRM